MKFFFSLICCIATLQTFAQSSDSVQFSKVEVTKDPRLDILAKKEYDLNELAIKIAARTAMGYRLQILSTNEREFAMKTKSDLLQKFPEQKTYMFYQEPFIKIRFGNFKTKQEADVYKKQISRMMNGANIYYIEERIEIKPDKDAKADSTQ